MAKNIEIARRLEKKKKAPRTPEEVAVSSLGKVFGKNAGRLGSAISNLIQPGSLGRIDMGVMTNPDGTIQYDQAGNPLRVGERSDLLNRFNIATQGYNAPELQAMREQAARGFTNEATARERSLLGNAARYGQRGGVVAAAQQGINRDKAMANADLEQKLMVEQATTQQERLKDYGNVLAGMRAEESGAQKFNLGQSIAEKNAQIQGLFGGIDLYQTNREANRSNEIARKLAGLSNGRGGGRGRGPAAPAPVTNPTLDPNSPLYQGTGATPQTPQVSPPLVAAPQPAPAPTPAPRQRAVGGQLDAVQRARRIARGGR